MWWYGRENSGGSGLPKEKKANRWHRTGNRCQKIAQQKHAKGEKRNLVNDCSVLSIRT